MKNYPHYFFKSCLCCSLLSSLLFLTTISQAQQVAVKKNAPVSKWAINAFEQRNFIENKGQFNKADNIGNSDIKFGLSNDGVEIYFTSLGVIYKHNEQEMLSQPGEAEKEIHSKSFYVHMNWEGANPNVSIVSEEPVKNYYTYPDLNDGSMKTTLKAMAFKKIIYKNLYPGIDIEYVFPENKKGIKYNVILHPGADASLVKMAYSGMEKMSLDPKGNLIIAASFGNFVDHLPLSFNENGGSVPSAFSLNGNTVSFKISGSTNQTIIIDPWTTTPTFTGFNKAYDVDFDLKGNVYIHGGFNPFQEIKLDNTGTILWTYLSSGINSTGYYGDFTVDGKTGNSYLVEGFNSSGARCIKLNAGGVQTGFFPGNSKQQEMWRAYFNNCTGTGVIAGGGTSNNFQAYILDSNVVNITPVNVLSANGPLHDFALLTIDNDTNCFMATARSVGDPSNFNNTMLRCPAKTLLPVVYSVPDGHSFVEVGSISYVNGGGMPNGMNGMAASKNFLYTYDGSVLKKWNKNVGTFVSSITVSTTMFAWGGLAVDDCDNIYLGVMDSIKRYDVNLAYVSASKMPNIVYDIRMGINNLLYICGNAFVTEAQITGASCNALTLSVTTSSNCSTSGFATVTVTSGGNGSYLYTWSPSGQTSQSATGLTSGIYTVTVTENSCSPKLQTQTVKITLGSGSSPTLTAATLTNVKCNGGTGGSASATATGGGKPPYTYLWSNGQSTKTITGLSAGIYTITVTDSAGCNVVQTIAITQPNPIVLTGNGGSICAGESIALNSNATGGTGSISYSWNPGGQTSSSISVSPTSTTTYTVTATDANGCTQTQTMTVTVKPKPVASFTANPTSGQAPLAVVFTNTSTGGSSYSWYFGDGGTANTQNATHTFINTGSYTVKLVVIGSNGCKDSITMNILADVLSSLIAPNVFSPNGDGNNDLFVFNSQGLKDLFVEIYDRWGLKMGEFNTITGGWDGKAANGKDAPEGTYYYILKAHGNDAKEYNLTGYLLLLRK